MPSTTSPPRLPPPAPSPKPSPYARLVERVWAALKRAGIEAKDSPWLVFGGGDPSLPLMGYCPACERGVVAIWIVDADPPRLRFEGCTDGCDFETVKAALR